MALSFATTAQVAAQKCGILDSGESLSSQQLSDLLILANNLLETWYTAQVIAIDAQLQVFTLAAGTYTPAAMPQFASTVASVTLPAAWDRVLELGLAIEAAGEFVRAVSPDLMQQFQDAFKNASPPGIAQIEAGQAK